MGLDLDLHAFVEELTKTIDDFDGQIAELEPDPKSTAFVLKLRRIISKVFSGESNSKSQPKPNENSSISNFGGKQSPGKEGEQVADETACRRNSYQLQTVKKKKVKFSKFQQKISEKRGQELEKADQNLRSVEIKTARGFYMLHTCLLCQEEFTLITSARRHVLGMHLKLGFTCKVCSAFFFHQESHRRHTSKCHSVVKEINMKSNSGRKTVKAHVYSQSKNLKSSGSGFSQDSNKTDKSFDPEENPNSNSNVKVRNPFEGFCLKRAMSAKIEMSRLNSDKAEKTAANIKSSKDQEDKKENARENKKSEVMEKGKKRAKTAPSKNHTANHEKSRIFDVEGAQLICGIERNFLV